MKDFLTVEIVMLLAITAAKEIEGAGAVKRKPGTAIVHQPKGIDMTRSWYLYRRGSYAPEGAVSIYLH